MEFSFQAVYDLFSDKLVGNKIPSIPYGPLLIRIFFDDNKTPRFLELNPELVLPFFLSQGGKDRLRDFIDESLKRDTENCLEHEGLDFCIVLINEGHIKEFPDDFKNIESMKSMGLIHDPEAKNVIIIAIHHSSGKRVGFLYIDKDRHVTYGPLRPPEDALLDTHLSADQRGENDRIH